MFGMFDFGMSRVFTVKDEAHQPKSHQQHKYNALRPAPPVPRPRTPSPEPEPEYTDDPEDFYDYLEDAEPDDTISEPSSSATSVQDLPAQQAHVKFTLLNHSPVPLYPKVDSYANPYLSDLRCIDGAVDEGGFGGSRDPDQRIWILGVYDGYITRAVGLEAVVRVFKERLVDHGTVYFGWRDDNRAIFDIFFNILPAFTLRTLDVRFPDPAYVPASLVSYLAGHRANGLQSIYATGVHTNPRLLESLSNALIEGQGSPKRICFGWCGDHSPDHGCPSHRVPWACERISERVEDAVAHSFIQQCAVREAFKDSFVLAQVVLLARPGPFTPKPIHRAPTTPPRAGGRGEAPPTPPVTPDGPRRTKSVRWRIGADMRRVPARPVSMVGAVAPLTPTTSNSSASSGGSVRSVARDTASVHSVALTRELTPPSSSNGSIRTASINGSVRTASINGSVRSASIRSNGRTPPRPRRRMPASLATLPRALQIRIIKTAADEPAALSPSQWVRLLEIAGDREYLGSRTKNILEREEKGYEFGELMTEWMTSAGF
ncbi:hypothetical protein Q8F55_005416 [Vanrija albida]|uniref:Uncharacterized protein n=1 Tax=Vanrija albida TaxID=181172 RepID=A0ABR3Q2L4_9TREE